MDNPKFSIITAAFNSEQTIEETFKSVLNQIYRNLEYIVVDGNSTDGTVDLIKKYEPIFEKAGIKFKWISEEDKGIYDAWNKGLLMATGDWVGFIGSDDIYYEDTFQRYAEFVLENPKHDFVSARAKMVSKGKVVRRVGEEWNWSTFRREMKVGHAGAIHNREYFKKYGKFDSSYRITGDYEILLRAKDELRVGFLWFYAAEMGAEGVSSKMIKKTLEEARRAKVETGGRNKVVAYLEMQFVHLKILLKGLFNKLKPDEIA